MQGQSSCPLLPGSGAKTLPGQGGQTGQQAQPGCGRRISRASCRVEIKWRLSLGPVPCAVIMAVASATAQPHTMILTGDLL